MAHIDLKKTVLNLRRKGKTYGEINEILKVKIPKSTLSNWCNTIPLSPKQQDRISAGVQKNIQAGRVKALEKNKEKRNRYFLSIEERIRPLNPLLKEIGVKKLILASLYLGEGTKINNGSVRIGNSNPNIILLFLNFLRKSYSIDESKFRCTIQCRADQNNSDLEEFWRNITGIPPAQFYKTRVDARTIGKLSKKLDYKGVCVVDYFSADIYWELMKIGEIIYRGL